MFRVPQLGHQNPGEIFIRITVLITGAIYFFYRFGLTAFDPASTEWLLSTDDGASYLLGWQYYRLEPWSFPLGRIDDYLAPLGTSIPLVDALPLLAIPLKTITHILPNPFQYFGIWTMINYSLQSLFGYLVLRTVSSSRLLCLAGAMFFLICPTFLYRHGHISLSSHWLLLAAMYIYLKPPFSWQVRAKVVAWFILLTTVSLVHTYLTIMVLGIGLADLTREFLVTRRLDRRQYFTVLAGLLGVLVFSWYLTGYLIYGGDTDLKAQGYGTFSMNLNAVINPLMYSRLLPALPIDTGQYEGFNYLGLGMLLLCMVTIYLLIKRVAIRQEVKPHKALLVVLICFLLFALSNRLLLGKTIILSNREFFFFKPIASAFRASGRFFWPVLYIGMACGFAIIIRYFKTHHALLILLAGLALQVFDISPMLNLRADFASRRFDSPLVSPHWQEAVASLDGIQTYPPFQHTLRLAGDFKYLVSLTVDAGKPVAAGYAARLAYRQSIAYQEELQVGLQSGNVDPDFLYIIRDSDFLKFYSQMIGNFRACNWDGYKVFLPKQANVTATNHYGDLTSTHLTTYLQQNRGKLLLVTITHQAEHSDCSVYQEVFAKFGTPTASSTHQGSYAAVVYNGEVLEVMSHTDEAAHWEFAPGHSWPGFRLARAVSMTSHSAPRHPVVSIQVDSQEEAINTVGVCIVTLDSEQDLAEVAHFSGVRGSQGVVLEINRR